MWFKCGWRDLTRRNTSANLEQVSNSIQLLVIRITVCAVTWELTLESFRTENYAAKHAYARLLCQQQRFARTNSDSDILATVEKADRVDILEDDCSTSRGFHEDIN